MVGKIKKTISNLLSAKKDKEPDKSPAPWNSNSREGSSRAVYGPLLQDCALVACFTAMLYVTFRTTYESFSNLTMSHDPSKLGDAFSVGIPRRHVQNTEQIDYCGLKDRLPS